MSSATFKLNSKTFTAERMERAFVCPLPNKMGTLTGRVLDWKVRSEDGTEFPVNDILFRLLFQPQNEWANKALQAKQITVRMSEGQGLGDTMRRSREIKPPNTGSGQ